MCFFIHLVEVAIISGTSKLFLLVYLDKASCALFKRTFLVLKKTYHVIEGGFTV